MAPRSGHNGFAGRAEGSSAQCRSSVMLASTKEGGLLGLSSRYGSIYDNGALCGASEGSAQYDCPPDDPRAFVHVEIVAFAHAAPLIG